SPRPYLPPPSTPALPGNPSVYLGTGSRMSSLPSLRRELVVAFAIIFAGALLVAVAGIILLLPRFSTPGAAVGYVLLLLAADVLVFALFGRFLVHMRILQPLEEMIAG